MSIFGRFFSNPVLWAAAIMTFALAAGCGGNTLRSSEMPASNVSLDGDYLIGPGDSLLVNVWREPDLSLSVPVRPDGKISTPLVEDLVAIGKTPSQLALEIEAELAEYIRAPEVTVIVQSFVGTFGEQIRVIGQAAQPQALPYRDGVTLMDVMIEVGGLTQFAAGNRSRVVRRVGDETREIRVRLDDLMNRGRIEHNMTMQPGDVVIIPESIF